MAAVDPNFPGSAGLPGAQDESHPTIKLGALQGPNGSARWRFCDTS